MTRPLPAFSSDNSIPHLQASATEGADPMCTPITMSSYCKVCAKVSMKKSRLEYKERLNSSIIA